MPSGSIIKKAERFEAHHRIGVFAGILIVTILVIRGGVHFYDPNPKLFGIDLHHFDYGLVLLLISSQLSLFGPRRYGHVYLLLTGVATSLILDQYWLIRRGPDAAGTTPWQVYNTSLVSAGILLSGFILVMLFVHSFFSKKHSKSR